MAQRKHLWPLFLLPVAAVLAFVWLGPPRGNSHDNAASGGAGNGPKVADLGGRARELPAENAPSNQAASENPPGPEPEGGEPPVEEATNTAREIDIYLGQLAHATKVNDQRGQTLAHESLRKCRPHQLVDERVLAALESERNAFVRTQFFAAYHAEEAKLVWASRALELRAGKFLGTDENYEAGEVDELGTYLTPLLMLLLDQFMKNATPDSRTLALLRNGLDTERPEWLLKQVSAFLHKCAQIESCLPLARSIEHEMKGFLERQSAAFEIRELVFVAYAVLQQDWPSLVALLDSPQLKPYLATVINMMRPGPTADELVLGPDHRPEMLRATGQSPELIGLLQRTLAGDSPVAEKQLLIQRLAQGSGSVVVDLLKSGLQRKDANLGDYLAAWGRVAKTPEDLKLLAESAAAADSATATGAIEGLRQCALNEAAAELARIVEQGGNPGLQSQALGALLARDNAKAETIVESYLGTDRDASVRAVAVAHIPAKNIDRMKKVVDEDASPRVRQAALTRLGDMKDKKLRSYFLSVAINDPQPLIRQQAKKYADELKD